jgi:hypothetical protein
MRIKISHEFNNFYIKQKILQWLEKIACVSTSFDERIIGYDCEMNFVPSEAQNKLIVLNFA